MLKKIIKFVNWVFEETVVAEKKMHKVSTKMRCLVYAKGWRSHWRLHFEEESARLLLSKVSMSQGFEPGMHVVSTG